VRGLLTALLVVLVTTPATASEWGTIVPGSSTTDSVRGQFGGPTRTEIQKVDKYDTSTWIYEGAQAPAGLVRMTVEFGILQAAGYQPGVVRSFKLEPRPGAFDRGAVLAGWGTPDRVGKQNGTEVFVYGQGLIVIFDKSGRHAHTLVFTPPQPLEPARPSR
jgi:hypothetical protein